MGLANKKKFDDALQVQYDSYIAKKLQEEEQLEYERWKKIENDDFELAKKIQEEEENKFKSSQNSIETDLSSFNKSVVDLTGTLNSLNNNHNSNNNNHNNVSSNNNISKRKINIIEEGNSFSTKKKQRQEIKKDISSNSNINSNFRHTNEIIKRESKNLDIKSPIKRLIEVNEKPKTIKKDVKAENVINNNKKSLINNALSNFNMNRKPKKEISNSLDDLKTELRNNEIKKTIEWGKYNKSNIFNKSPSKKDNLPKRPIINNINNINNDKLLSDNNNNKNNSNTNKYVIKGNINNNNDNITNDILLEQLQREEVLINSLSDNPFVPPKKRQTIALDKVQSIILEQERLLQEYNRKRKGKEEEETKNEKRVLMKDAINSNNNNNNNYNNYNKKKLEPLKKFNVRNINELDDPCPDLHQLFLLFNAQYFEHKLDSVEVRWSKRMTLCAGICYYYRGGYCSVRLSEPLLKFRTRDDFINTLLHEMIHAYLFLTEGNKDHDGHGESFHRMMYKLNKETGSHITVYHNFHNEVNHYRTHVWRCNGPCRFRPPFFGYVRRSMNRKPQKADSWWRQHQATCGGEFIKISEPEEYTKKKLKKKGATVDTALLNQASTSNIETFNRLKNINTIVNNKSNTKKIETPSIIKPVNNSNKTNIFSLNNINKSNKTVKGINPINTINNKANNSNVSNNINGLKNFGNYNGINTINRFKNINTNIGSNIHGFGNLGNNSKVNTINSYKSGGTNIGSNIHGFNHKSCNIKNNNNNTIKKKNQSIYDILKKKK
jgi:predicted SprT family Zn-dependent metalloprotease